METETDFKTFETDLRLGLFPSRKLILERNKALSHARNPGKSKYGQCLVSVNTRLNNILKVNLKTLNDEFKRMELHNTQKMKNFIKTSGILNHEPLLLVHRPKSGPLTETPSVNVPGFMKPRSSKVIRPSSLKTIDVFTVQPAKKKNLWESLGDNASFKFTGVVRPCAKLSENEFERLKNEYIATKPSLKFDSFSKGSVTLRSTASADQRRIKDQIWAETDRDDSDDNNTVTEHQVDSMVYAGDEDSEVDDAFEFDKEQTDFSKSSSFLTEMQTSGMHASTKNEQTFDLRNNEIDSKSMAETNRAISEPEDQHTDNIQNEGSRSDTRQIPYTLPSMGDPVHLKQNFPTDFEVKTEVEATNSSEPKTESDDKQMHKATSALVKRDLSTINVAKGTILENVYKTRPQSLPPRKKRPFMAKSASINKIKNSRHTASSLKSVKFVDV